MVEIDRYAVKIAAQLKGVRGELRTEAAKIADRAKGLLAPHDHPGGAKITTSRGGIDYFANLDDEDGDAGAIEAGGVRPDGSYQPGLHIMRRAAES